ncbi:MAG: cation:proton antiporter [Nitrososphaerota archaeon]|nr:cation:proton antiporter [Nitrososphaerota archaeon]MDG7036149.1 cation:proton antiporter [Nitrososphaerota archaeon]MDG7037786.1 cation:proton antiporter [Nitrososphaerota archaeon]
MIPVFEFFLLASLIIFIGFFGNIFFRKTGFPEVLFLIAVGIIIGPLFKIIPTSIAYSILPYFSDLTLAMILFNIGIQLDLRSLFQEGIRAIGRTVLYVSISVIVIFFIFSHIFNWGTYSSLLLSVIIGGETTTVVVPELVRSLADKRLFTNLTIESVLNSVILIVLFFVFLNGFLNSTPISLAGATDLVGSFFSQFSIGIVVGLIAAIVWVKFLQLVGVENYFYIATIGYVLLIYEFVEQIGGSAILAVLTMAITMVNLRFISDPLSIYLDIPKSAKQYIIDFQGEISFFLKTFFFLFLGMVLSVSSFSSPLTYLLAGIVIVVLALSRLTAIQLVNRDKSAEDRKLIFYMMAQGLTPAVLATTLLLYPVPHREGIVLITTLVIIITNIITTIGSVRFKQGWNNLNINSKKNLNKAESDNS